MRERRFTQRVIHFDDVGRLTCDAQTPERGGVDEAEEALETDCLGFRRAQLVAVSTRVAVPADVKR